MKQPSRKRRSYEEKQQTLHASLIKLKQKLELMNYEFEIEACESGYIDFHVRHNKQGVTATVVKAVVGVAGFYFLNHNDREVVFQFSANRL